MQRDRAPVFVPLADGSIRNGYTLKIVNKSQLNGAFDLSVGGLPGAGMAIAESEPTAGADAAPAGLVRRGRDVPRAR